METIQIRVTKKQLHEVDKLVKYGVYNSRSEAVRDAVRRLQLLATLTELQEKAKEKGIKQEELLEELRKVRNEVDLT